MLRLPIYGNKTIKLAFEFAVVFFETARELKKELTREMIEKAESIFLNEIKTKGFKRTALNFVPLVLASLEPNDIIKKASAGDIVEGNSGN